MTKGKIEQINKFDSRFYFIPDVKPPQEYEYLVGDGGVYMPSSTHILDVAFAKGTMFNNWLKDVGHNSKVISEIAAEKGTRVHRACELLLLGNELRFDDIIDTDRKHVGKYMSLEEWEGVMRFKDFYDQVKPTNVTSESIVFNKDYFYAGTVDIVCEINGEKWLIDIKFGNSVYESYFLQAESYARCIGDIDRIGILHLKAKTRGERKGKIQGKGWNIVEPPNSRDELWQIWLGLLKMYKFKNNNEKPKSISYPTTIKL